MKWIGQHIWSLISRFRNDIYLEDISSGTIASGGNLGLDSNNKIVKATEATGDITGVTITTDSGGGSAASDTAGSADFSILGTSGAGVTNSGTTITVTTVPGEIDHDSLLNFASNEHYTQANITTVGTIDEGVWNGDEISTTYTAAKVESIAAGDGIDISGATGDVTITAETASDSNPGVVELATTAETTTGTDAGRAVTPDGLKDGFEGSTNISVLGTISTGVWNGTAIASAYIADDAVTFAKASGVSPKVFGSTIKILPSDFMSNDDGGSTKFGIGFVEADGTGFGMKIPNAGTELLAFVSIPEGMKATHVDVFDQSDDRAIEVFEANVNSRTITSKGSGNCNTTLDITDVNATAVNYLLILVTTTATSDRVYGGTVTIAAQ